MQKSATSICKLTLLILTLTMAGCGSDKNQDRSWSVYKADENSSSYSSLDQINTSNVKTLQTAWSYDFGDVAAGGRAGVSQSNPIIVDGVMYTTSARVIVYALDAETGKKIWSYDPFDGQEGSGPVRAVTYWQKNDDKRIIFSAGNYLFALNATTGELVPSFGDNGRINLNVGLRDDPEKISVAMTSPGIVYKDLIITGLRLPDVYDAPPGYIRAYDCKTGKLVWTFHTIPHPGEPGYETWPKDAYKYAGSANNWAGMSVDSKRGIVYIPLGAPSYDFYGADRTGANLYGNSLLALDAATGKYVWHYQIVHHDLWDYDLPAPPNLVTIKKDGKPVDAVVQLTKHGFVFVFDRQTGKSLFPIEERKVPVSNMPGEHAWPTQPFPLKPAPYSRQHITEADLTNFPGADHEATLKRFRSLRYEGMFTPPDQKGTLVLPGTLGGVEWGGAAYDPETSMLYFKSNDSPEIQTIAKVGNNQATTGLDVATHGRVIYQTHCASCHGADRESDKPAYPSLTDVARRMKPEQILSKIQKGAGVMPAFGSSLTSEQQEAVLTYLSDLKQSPLKVAKSEADKEDTSKERLMNITAYQPFLDDQGNPALRPPWGTLHALNLATGEYEWQIPYGNKPKYKLPGMPDTGQDSKPGPIVTAGGLIFIAGTADNLFRAFDKKAGKMLWQKKLPAIANAIPSTYQIKGKQYVALSVAGTEENPSGSIMVFALP
ncbi:pyrroloquinoline quinone-dependent dehydrogenase [Dyadobacter luteus]|uniref:Pyrroloquinoline quinone-dependent dehydrogenase n=1 Tax=Dyadobacter luteus TaxID=2259619 RepID=A0A3D8YEC3_9BACT|nr:pyrroloquinoline quinone-dependent dehydrogenase [Dyadobacter luteus]REA62842.1 pyrroloquinoline quinone-dependent dehydrogenase [Dyadobacter luteus]